MENEITYKKKMNKKCAVAMTEDMQIPFFSFITPLMNQWVERSNSLNWNPAAKK